VDSQVNAPSRSTLLVRAAALVAVTLAAFAVRAFIEGDPGPLFVIPVLLAAYWWGRWGGLAAGVLETGVFLGARAVNPPDEMNSSALAAGGFRLLVYCLAGYGVGWLIDDRRKLRAKVDITERHVQDLLALQEALAPPDLPDRPKLELASCYVPAQGGVAGDFFLVQPGPGDCTVIVVGDVAGKGLAAAKRAAFVRMAMVTAAAFEDDPCRLLAIANSNLIERAGASDCFVTAVCVVVDPSQGKLKYALAGHPPPLMLDDGRSLNSVKPAFPLGIGADIDCELGELDFAPGTGFVAFTDGLIEARRNGGDLFGMQRTAELLAQLRGRAPRAVVGELRAAAERFAGGSLADDLCMVAVRAAG
jgi:serine phosphatase RsbU (regulator of sigma subunit)